MIVSFADSGTEDIWQGENSKRARKTCPRGVWNTASRRLDALEAATSLEDLAAIPSHRLEKLRGDRKGQHSVSINMQYRICFRWTERGPAEVEIVDYHH